MRSAASSSRFAAILLAASLCSVPEVAGVSFASVPSPNLDLSQLGRVALAGDFDSLSLYQWEGQNQNGYSTNGSTSLLGRFPSGAFANLQTADAYIRSMCPFVLKNGTLQGVVVGGNFTSLGGQKASSIALVNATNAAITPLEGLSGKVNTVYCDKNSSTVYVGGSFSGGNSTNAIAWTNNWANLPFAGFNGEVRTIKAGPTGKIIFGGSFDGLGNTTTPKTRDVQVVPVASANITAVGGSTTPGFSEPRDIICKTGDQDGPGNTWLAADKSAASWTANFQFGFVPTKLRLYNTVQPNRGTKTWRLTALPLGGIMNLTWTNPDGIEIHCDATCPLPQNNKTFQDFHFVNHIGMNGFRIDISDWWGDGAGLSGIELFQDDIYSFAVNEFNEPTCDSVSTQALSSNTGTWKVQPSGGSNSAYLTISGAASDLASSSVVFSPNIKQSGNYTVTIYTPGCQQDNTCGNRGRVNITGVMADISKTQPPPPVELYQTNNFDKYDQIYYGYVEAGSGGFRPKVTLTPSTNQNGQLTVVAQRVRFELQSSTGGLNGLFEYDENTVTVDTDFSKSAIDAAGMTLNAGAVINSVEVQDDVVYVAGNFSATDYANVFSISGGNSVSLPGGGLNDEVMTTYHNGSMIYMGGKFTQTRDGKTTIGLNGVCAYSIGDKAWQPLGAGVNGIVNYLVPLTLNITGGGQNELVISVNGDFDEVNGFGQNPNFPASGLAIWVPSKKNWLHNLGGSNIAINGKLTAETDVPGFGSFWAGAVSSQALAASGSVFLSGMNLQQSVAKIQPRQVSPGSSLSKRAISGQNVTGAVTGLIYDQNNLNITIIGGHFSATATNGSTINNLLFINGSNSDSVTGINDGLVDDSVFLALSYYKTTLFAGGTLQGTVNNNKVDGLVLYDLAGNNFVPTQPPTLTGSHSVAVNAIAPQPSGTNVYVGGDFDGAGSFSCPSVCIWDTIRSQWSSPGVGIGGSIGAMAWTSNTRLLIGGNLTVNNVATTMAVYDTGSRNFTAFTGANDVPGPVTALCDGSSDGTQFWVAGKATNGSAFLEKYDGKQWYSLGSNLGTTTVIRGLQVLSVSKNHANSATLPQNQVLLIMGQIEIPNFGNASAAVYNGTTIQPFLLTTLQSNTGGTMSQLFVQNPDNVFKTGHKKLAVGYIVLISLAIALALTFLLIVAGILAERLRRKRDGYQPAPTHIPEKPSNMNRLPPEELFHSIGPGAGRSVGRL